MNIIFDLDGTLLNTLDDLHNSVCHALASARLPKIDRLVTRRFLGNGVKSLIDNCVTHACPEANERMKEEVFHAFRQYYMLHSMDKTAPYPGVVEMLRQCKESGLNTAIVSNKLNEAVQDLHRRFFAQYIDLAIGETPSVKRKPAPDMVYEAMRRLSDMKGKQIEKVDCVYVGDGNQCWTGVHCCQLGIPRQGVDRAMRSKGHHRHSVRTAQHPFLRLRLKPT